MSFRSSLIIFILVCFVISTKAQVADLITHIRIKDSIISKFNRGDFNEIYEMADSSFRKFESREKFIEFLKRVNQAGAILSSELTEDLGEVKYFRLQMKNISADLTLTVTPQQRFSLFAIQRSLPYDTTSVNNIQTDNPLRSPLDSGLDRSVRKHIKDKQVVGLSIGIIKNGKLYTYNYGEVKKGEGHIPTANTYYEIGSITKTFTTTVLAHAVLDGKLKLNDDIRNYLADPFPNLQFENHPIEVVNLANHTSRLPGIPDDFFKQTPYDSLNPYVHYSETMFWDALHRLKIDTLPGIKKYYSNFGISLLGHILERVYQDDYKALVKRMVLMPLKMKDSKFELGKNEYGRMAQGYNKNGQPNPPWDIGPFTAAGAIKSTVNDMLKYLQYNIEEKAAAVQLAHRLTWGTNSNGTALGWFVSTTPGGNTIYQHDGGTGGFVSDLVVMPERKLGFVILSNSTTDLGNLSREITYRLSK
jgi:D-alanyl-D-alanine-carboxypeptidase/D-alanyl-D-alanine-endopeptidase